MVAAVGGRALFGASRLSKWIRLAALAGGNEWMYVFVLSFSNVHL